MIITVPAPMGGAIVVGESVVAYIGQGQQMKCTEMTPTIIRVGFGPFCKNHLPKAPSIAVPANIRSKRQYLRKLSSTDLVALTLTVMRCASSGDGSVFHPLLAPFAPERRWP